MFTLAVAALALAGPARLQNQSAPICPFYDMRTTVDTSGNVTVNFYLSAPWNGTVNNIGRFTFYFSNGNLSMNNFGPGGTWYPIAYSTFVPPVGGNLVTITFPNWNFNNFDPHGCLWVQYNAGSNETMDAIAEYCVIATTAGAVHSPSGGDRPGSVVPIIDRTPDSTNTVDAPVAQQNVNQSMTFYISTGFSGWPDNKTPGMWCNTGNNNSPYPGNGWQNMNYSNMNVANGYTQVTATGHPNSNAGWYMVGYQQTYIPNGGSGLFTEFSGFARPITGS